MDAYEKYQYLLEHVDPSTLLDMVFDWFTTDEMDDCMDDMATDLEVEFPEGE